MASGAAPAAGASVVAAGPAASSWGVASGSGGVAASGSEPLGPVAPGAGVGGVPAGVVADPQQGKMKVLARGRTPQLERLRRTCSMRLKDGACHITDMVRAPEDKWRNEKL
jgi:hypothetical protein